MNATHNLRVLCLARSYGENAGGMERLSYEYIDTLYRQPGVTVSKIVLPYKDGTSLKIHRLRSILFAFTVIPGALAAARTVDVIHLGDPLLSLVGWLIKKIWKKPVVVSVHGLDVSFPNPVYQWYLHTFFSGFDLYVPISRAARGQLQKFSLAGKVEVIHPGLRDRLFDPTRTHLDLEELLGFAVRETKILLTHGRLVARKGQAWFIGNVLPLLSPSVHYVVSGEGEERPKLKALAQALNLSNRVHFLGKVSEEHLAVLYNSADVYVQPNVPVAGDTEGFGLVVLEAAACERIVVAANLEGLAEAITDKQNGYLVPSQNALAWREQLEKVFQLSPAESHSLGKQARDYTLQKFAWPKIIKQHVDAIRKIVINYR